MHFLHHGCCGWNPLAITTTANHNDNNDDDDDGDGDGGGWCMVDGD